MTVIYAADDDRYEGIAKEIFEHKQKCSSCGEFFFVAYIVPKPYGEITFNNDSSFCPFCGNNPRNKKV